MTKEFSYERLVGMKPKELDLEWENQKMIMEEILLELKELNGKEEEFV